tara:strand:- start:454 stop:1113 length:660 start_codon:yes stop_codon:yes gene_type:complete
MTAWSYSSIKTFEQCPKKYNHLRVLRDVSDTGGPAALYGQDVHKAIEDYFCDGTPIPPHYAYVSDAVAAFEGIPGEKHAELRLGVVKEAQGFSPCAFDDPSAWWRGIADLVVINGTTAIVNDWKTGKSMRYADTKQLDLLAGAVFVHFPAVQKVKSSLTFLVAEGLLKKIHHREHLDTYLGVFDNTLDALQIAHDTGVWNAKSSGLCGWCPVKTCEHNR